MLSLILGILIAIAGVIMALTHLQIAYLLVFMLGVLICVICTTQPLAGWEEKDRFDGFELVPLVLDKNIYIIESELHNYMYKCKFGGGSEEIHYALGENTMYQLLENNEKAKIITVVMKAKKTLWAFPIGCSRQTKILHVPKNSILR